MGGPAKAGSTSWKLTSHGEGVVDALTQAGLWASLTAEVAARFRHDLVIWGPHLRKAEVRFYSIDAFPVFYFHFKQFLFCFRSCGLFVP